MLIVLCNCSPLMTYDSGHTSSGDSETLVLHITSQIFGLERCNATFLGKFDL